MKADCIMVVKDGEIIEHGSHEELIHSKGKYHDLWSKQILVKPVKDVVQSASRSTSRSRSRSPQKKRVAVIVNDLEPERPKTELAHALRTTNHSEGERSVLENSEQETSATNRSQGNQQGSNTDTENMQKLKADAPEFIPCHLRNNETAPENTGKVESKHDTKERIRKEKDERKTNRGNIRKAAKKAGKKPEALDGKPDTF